jgi:hypothetical protein
MRSPLAVLVVAFMFIALEAHAQNAALRIVVLKGEDAVNIIQQKTAVAPVIEVRDRNNLPVAGATVTFSVTQGATFGGASSITVVTNAAGQAAATGFAPTAAGAIQIQATAAFQGQTVAATIAQSNVMTAAQAAGAGAGSTSTTTAAAAGGGGGGMSGTLIGVVAAVAGGGAVAATQLGKKEETSTSSSSPTSTTSSTTTTTTTTPTPTPTTPTPTPQPSSASYSGDMRGSLAGPLSIVWHGPGPVFPSIYCTTSLLQTARVILNLVTQPSGEVTGNISFEGGFTEETPQCQMLYPQSRFSASGTVSGTADNLRFRSEYREGGPHPVVFNNTYTLSGSMSFSGSISGNTLSGVFAHVVVYELIASNAVDHVELSASIPVTLTKS